MVIEGTRCHENSGLHRDRRAGRAARMGRGRVLAARQAVRTTCSGPLHAAERECH